jgi:hypothetical protein
MRRVWLLFVIVSVVSFSLCSDKAVRQGNNNEQTARAIADEIATPYFQADYDEIRKRCVTFVRKYRLVAVIVYGNKKNFVTGFVAEANGQLIDYQQSMGDLYLSTNDSVTDLPILIRGESVGTARIVLKN